MDEKSKSQKKREASSLQDLGNQLIALSPDDLASFPLTPALSKAIADAKTMKSHGAKRRQAQWIGKLMRTADHAAIAAAFQAFQAEDNAQTAKFHAAEIWREKLLNGGNAALSEFIETFKPEDIQQLRQLIHQAQCATDPMKIKFGYKALFRFIRPYL